jgi:hypothetical protein
MDDLTSSSRTPIVKNAPKIKYAQNMGYLTFKELRCSRIALSENPSSVRDSNRNDSAALGVTGSGSPGF